MNKECMNCWTLYKGQNKKFCSRKCFNVFNQRKGKSWTQ